MLRHIKNLPNVCQSVCARINEFLNDTKCSWYIFGLKKMICNEKVILTVRPCFAYKRDCLVPVNAEQGAIKFKSLGLMLSHVPLFYKG